MAKINRRKLRWSPSDSPQVLGYKLYWAVGGKVDYDAEHHTIGNVTEITLPDDVPMFPCANGPIELGLTAVNEVGNESDMVTLSVPFQFSAPNAPRDLGLERQPGVPVPSSEAEGQAPPENSPDEAPHQDHAPASSTGKDPSSLETFQV